MSISMEEALGLQKPEPKVEVVSEEEEMDKEYSPAELNKIRRDKIILEETANKGSTIPEICEILREKGVPASERTVWTVLHSDRATKLREELERSQFRDIALLRAYALQNKNNPNLKALAAAIAARGRSIQNLTPNSQPYVNVDVKVDNKIDVSKEVEAIIKFSREEDAGK